MSQFHFDPDTYEEEIAAEVPSYGQLQDAVVAAVRAMSDRDGDPRRVLDLGTGTGVTAGRMLEALPEAQLVGIDESAEMLGAAREVLPADADLRVSRLEDPLPAGPFDLVVSALAVHHLDGPGKADLFARVGDALSDGGRFVLGDVIVPLDPADVVTPIDGVYDKPSPVADQLAWLETAGFSATVAWSYRDLAVLVGDLPHR